MSDDPSSTSPSGDDAGFGKPSPADDGGPASPGAVGRVDRVTEISTTSWFGRLRDSVIGALIGIVLVVAGIALLAWNEKNELRTIRGLDFGAASVVGADAAHPDPTRDGKLVHVSGLLASATPARDPVFGPVAADAVRLERHIEMFQWKENKSSATQKNLGGSSTTQTTYEYERAWSDRPVDSNDFHVHAGHANPPMQLRTEWFDAPDATPGARKLGADVLDRLGKFTAVQAGPDATPPSGWKPEDGGFYRGLDPARPAVGDARVRFSVVFPGPISVIAGQQGDRLAGFATPNGQEIALAVPGTVAAAAMFAGERSEVKLLAWVIRFVGFVVIDVGLILMVNPLGVVVSVLPFLESAVDVATSIVMFGLAACITLVTVAIAHIVLQPLLSAGLLAAGMAVFVLCARFRGGRGARRAAA